MLREVIEHFLWDRIDLGLIDWQNDWPLLLLGKPKLILYFMAMHRQRKQRDPTTALPYAMSEVAS